MRNRRPAPAPVPKGIDILRVAYHDGPPAVRFFGIDWQRGVPQTITGTVWAEMQARADFREFDFRSEPAASPASTEE